MFGEFAKIQKLYRQHPQSPLFARLADLYLRRGEVAPALELCREGCKRFPHYPTGYLILGKCYEAQGQFEEARTAIDQALRLDPENPAGFAFLSRVYQELGIPTLALKSMEQAVALEPLSPTLAEEVDRLTYEVRVESTAEAVDRGIPDVPPEPVIRPAPPEPETAQEEEIFAAPAASAAQQAEPFAVLQPLPKAELQAEPAQDEPLFSAGTEEEDVLPLEESIEALFRRGEEQERREPPAREKTAPARGAVPEKPPHPAGVQESREDLSALGAQILADDSLLWEPPAPIPADEGAAPEEGLFSPAEAAAQARAALPEEEEVSLFEPVEAALPEEEEVSLFEPEAPEPEQAVASAGEEVREFWPAPVGDEPLPEPLPALEELLPATPAAEEAARPAQAPPPVPAPAAEPAAGPGRQAGTGLSRRQDDEELIRLFQEIENQQQQELEARRQAAPPAESGEQEGRIATVTLAQIYASQGLAEKALETYRQILAQDPGNEAIRRKIEELQQGRKTA